MKNSIPRTTQMNVVVLNGSPRKKGNTAHALKCICQGMPDGYEIQWIDAAALSLRGCNVCDGCKKNGGQCVHNDGTCALMETIMSADLILFGTPVYYWGISAQLKLVIDKFYSVDEALHTLKKKIGIVAVGGDALDNIQYRLISSQFKAIADFLGWDVVLDQSISALEPGDLEKDAARCAELTALGASL